MNRSPAYVLGDVWGDVAQKHQSYFPRSFFRIAIAIADAPTLKWRAISATDIPILVGEVVQKHQSYIGERDVRAERA